MNKFTATLLTFIFSLYSTQLFAEKIALTNTNILDVKSLKILENQTIVIENDRIVDINNSHKISPNSETLIVDMAGKFVLPGLIDAHVHHATDPEGWDNRDDTINRLQNLLRGGVTSVRDMGGDGRTLMGLAREASLDVIQSPDIYYSVIIGGPEFFADPRTISSAKGMKSGHANWMKAVTNETNLDHVMLKALGTGATGIKIYAKVPASLIEKLAEKAKKYGLKVWSHVYVGPAKPSAVINAGVETVSHSPDFSAEVITEYRNWRRKDIPPNPEEEKLSYQASSYDALFQQMKLNNTLLDATLTVFESRKNTSENTKKRYRHAVMLTKLANEHGVKITAGTDAFSDENVQLYHELSLLVNDAKLTPFQAIQAATINGAETIGIENSVGSIEIGKKANFLVLSKDPTSNIANINTVAHVIKNGKFIYRGSDQTLPFVVSKKAGGMLWMSGQLGNLPSTKVLAGKSIEAQMKQTMQNIGDVLKENKLNFSDITKCTLMLADINDWQKASEIYKTFFDDALPARSAFATDGLALGAKAEIECIAEL